MNNKQAKYIYNYTQVLMGLLSSDTLNPKTLTAVLLGCEEPLCYLERQKLWGYQNAYGRFWQMAILPDDDTPIDGIHMLPETIEMMGALDPLIGHQINTILSKMPSDITAKEVHQLFAAGFFSPINLLNFYQGVESAARQLLLPPREAFETHILFILNI